MSNGEAEWPAGSSNEHVDDPDTEATNDSDVPCGECDQLSADRPFDWNITPVTAFMGRLTAGLREYAVDRVAIRSDWGNLRIAFSDAPAPSESEHEIQELVRIQRAMPGYGPTLRHVLYRLDAGLIMLALATQEIHFTVLREEVWSKQGSLRKNDPEANQPTPAPTRDSIQAAVVTPSDKPTKDDEDSSNTGELLGCRKPFHFL